MNSGNVKWFDRRKGFGFIVGPAGEDVFVHFSSIESNGFRSLKHGERVQYELVQTDRGLQAAQVRPVRISKAPRPRNDQPLARGATEAATDGLSTAALRATIPIRTATQA